MAYNDAITAGICGPRNGVEGSSCTAAIPSGPCRRWVKSGNSHREHMLSALPPRADIQRRCFQIAAAPSILATLRAEGITHYVMASPLYANISPHAASIPRACAQFPTAKSARSRYAMIYLAGRKTGAQSSSFTSPHDLRGSRGRAVNSGRSTCARSIDIRARRSQASSRPCLVEGARPTPRSRGSKC